MKNYIGQTSRLGIFSCRGKIFQDTPWKLWNQIRLCLHDVACKNSLEVDIFIIWWSLTYVLRASSFLPNSMVLISHQQQVGGTSFIVHHFFNLNIVNCYRPLCKRSCLVCIRIKNLFHLIIEVAIIELNICHILIMRRKHKFILCPVYARYRSMTLWLLCL